jgi:hypothetical protein
MRINFFLSTALGFAKKIYCHENCQKFPFPKCQKFPFETVKNFLFKLSKISLFQTVKNSLFKLSKISLFKLSKFPFSNCQKFPFQTVKNFHFKLSKISFPKSLGTADSKLTQQLHQLLLQTISVKLMTARKQKERFQQQESSTVSALVLSAHNHRTIPECLQGISHIFRGFCRLIHFFALLLNFAIVFLGIF